MKLFKSKNSYLKGLSSSYLYILLSILVSFFMIPFSLHYLTKEEFGIFTVANELLLWLGLLEFGTVSVLKSKASHFLGGDKSINFNTVVSSAFFLQLLAGLMILFIGFIMSNHMETFFDLDNSVHNIDLVFQIMVLGLSLSISTNVFSSLLIAAKQVHIDNYLRIGMLLLKTIITIILLMNGFKLISLAIANLVAVVVISGIAFYRIRGVFPGLKISYANIRFMEMKSMIGKGWWFTVGGLAGIFINSLDSLLIGKFISVGIVANFVITKKLFDTAHRFIMQIFHVSRPYFGSFYGAQEYKKIQILYQLSINVSIYLTVLISIVILLINKWFISIWVGSEFYLGDVLSMLLAFNFILQSAVIPNRILFSSTLYEVKKQNFIRIEEGVVNLILSVVLINYFGVNGAIIASIIATLIFSNIYLNKLSNDFFLEYTKSKNNYSAYVIMLTLVLIYILSLQNIYTVYINIFSIIMLGTLFYIKHYNTIMKLYKGD